ncbi:hypothetical protein ASPCAL03440 [Aspergillus calidoustus]|uniref:Uncharacterized protein n=1 Tax=Aspergillus calidoustus TaxID=454130 RepID=A0A0U5FUK5_ASPCI|nr:hypothetical protein ASPCAL03440 [Aspergillus calidoustus]
MGEARRRWTASEDALLWDLYQIEEKAPTGKSQKINWNEIARQIPGRSNKDCRKRYYNRFTGGLRKGSWTQDEDERLFQLVERYQYRWAAIAQKMETRNADQCSKRWHHCLNPELERSPWTDGENTLLLSAVGVHGSSWKEIQRSHFPTRSANNIKNQYTILSRKSLPLTTLHPCCASPPRTKPSSRRLPSSIPSASCSTSTSSTTSSYIPSSSCTSTSDTYTYNSLTSTPQLAANDYLPATPETTGSISAFNFPHAMPLSSSGDPGAFPFDYRAAMYAGSGGIDLGNTGFGGCDAAEMGYGVDIGVGVSGFGEGPLLRYTQFSAGGGFGL